MKLALSKYSDESLGIKTKRAVTSEVGGGASVQINGIIHN